MCQIASRPEQGTRTHRTPLHMAVLFRTSKHIHKKRSVNRSSMRSLHLSSERSMRWVNPAERCLSRRLRFRESRHSGTAQAEMRIVWRSRGRVKLWVRTRVNDVLYRKEESTISASFKRTRLWAVSMVVFVNLPGQS